MLRLQYLVAFTALTLLAPQAVASQEDRSETRRQLKLFSDVFERVRADYVEEVTGEELIESAIQAMLTSLDMHSRYLNRKSFDDMQIQTKGAFGGLGMRVTMENGLVKVISPIDDTPAYRAGMQAGDLISHLDGEPIMGLSLSETIMRIRGPVNTDIRLTVRRGDTAPFDVTITRDVIKIRSVRSRREDTIGYIRITTFNRQTSAGVEKAIGELKEEIGDEIAGYIIDLRNNPGGLLSQAIAVSDAFLNQGEIVSTRGRNENEARRVNARAGDLAEGLPIVVLINRGSASASEIVAGALQYHRRAIVMGTRSVGKASVQRIISLSDHSAIRLTTARYFTPSGRLIQSKGIDPDIEVEQARIVPVPSGPRRHEADLRNALENTGGVGVRRGETGATVEATKEGKPPDYQLVQALDLLRSLSLFAKRAQQAAPSARARDYEER